MTPIIRVHPLFFSQPMPGRRAVVRWYLCGDGECLGKRFYDSTKACQASLTAKLRQLEQDGVTSNYMGHYLQEEYSKIFEFVLRRHRFFCFRHLDQFFVTNGGMKDPKTAEHDYRIALRCRNEFFDHLENPPQRRSQ